MNNQVSLVSSNNVINVGHFEIKWSVAKHHLAYKRFCGIQNLVGSLSQLYTSDLKPHKNLDIYTDDDQFVKMALRALIQCKRRLIYVNCVGCGLSGAPTTDNVPIGWHAKCWVTCLDTDERAADGYIKHLEKDLPQRINKYFPKLQPSVFKSLYDTLSDIFWIQLYDLKTLGKHRMIRYNDVDQVYSGICSFNILHMKQNRQYFDHIIKLMHQKQDWYSMGIKYSCITYDSFRKTLQKAQCNSECKDKRVDPTSQSNNQANKPVFNSNKTM